MQKEKKTITKEQLVRRQQLRRKRRRKLILKRVLAIGVLVLLCLVVVLLVNKVVKIFTTESVQETAKNQEANQQTNSGQKKAIVENTEKTSQTEPSGKDSEKMASEKEVEVLQAQEVEEVSIKISSAGDCTLGTDANFDASSSFKAKYNEVGYPGYFFENVKSIFSEDDLSIVNLEGTFTNSNDRQDKTYAFKGDSSYVEILKEGSIEAVNVANNHSKDYGLEGFEDTKRYVTEAGIAVFGYDETKILDIKGVKVGLVGIYELPDGLGRMQQVKDNVEKVKNEGAVLVIVSFHWGTEKENYPDSIQKQLAHQAIDSGADLVVGHHPHVLQGIETYKGKKIAYSLGNFCFGGNKNPSDKDTMIFQQTFIIRDNKVVQDENVRIIPCSISSVTSRNNYQPTVSYGEEANRILQKIETFSNGLER